MNKQKYFSAICVPLVVGALLAMTGIAKAQDCTAAANADELSSDQLNQIYDCLADKMASGYSASGLALVELYKADYIRVSTAPYVSGTHGNRFVNNYVNDTGADTYFAFEEMGGPNMPVGSIALKDSFAVKDDGSVAVGPLFMMEKMDAGFDEAAGDWQYTLMFPNGNIVGQTGGENGDKVAFCNDCHVATLQDFDAMFFLPEEVRASRN